MLPIASQQGIRTPFLEALFTSTSAVCVTGLVLHDTATYWSNFGQLVILLLIQIGGLGVVTVGGAFAILSGRRIGLMQRSTMQEAIAAPKGRRNRTADGIHFEIRAGHRADGRHCPFPCVFSGIWIAQRCLVCAFPLHFRILQRRVRPHGNQNAVLIFDRLCRPSCRPHRDRTSHCCWRHRLF